MARASHGRFTVWLRASATRWHAHADLCSIAIRLDEELVVGDPGTGSYNGDDDERRWFRSSRAHAVAEVGGREQVAPHRAFRWERNPWCAVGMPVQDGDTTVLWAAHAAYAATVVRIVIVEPREVTVVDHLAPHGAPPDDPPPEIVVRFPLAPRVRGHADGTIAPSAVAPARLWVPDGATIEVEPARWSPTYGAVRSSDAMVVRDRGGGPTISSLTLGEPPTWRSRAGGCERGGTRVALRWRGTVIELHLASPRATTVRELRAPHHAS